MAAFCPLSKLSGENTTTSEKLLRPKRQFHFFVLLALSTAIGTGAHAKTNERDVATRRISQDAPPPAIVAEPVDGRYDEEEIVVTADRFGEATVAAESEFNEAEIASQGVDSIQDLLTRLSPLIDPSGEEPVILINGKSVGFDRSILTYPPEALQRLAVLSSEAAAQYGEPPSKRVVNLVLKKQFSMWSADVGINFPTSGGQFGKKLSATRTAISGHARWNIMARFSDDSALRKSARAFPPRNEVFDSVGFVAAPDGGEVDPGLSLVAGGAVTVAAIPLQALATDGAGPPSITDFAVTANSLHPVDPSDYETLQSSHRTASLSIGFTKPLGSTFSATLNLSGSSSSNEGQRGLPMASVLIPAGNPWSPFTGDVVLTRPFEGERALRNANNSTSLGASLTVDGSLLDWKTSFGLSYTQNWSRSLLETGIDLARVEQAVSSDPTFNPYGFWDKSLLLATRSSSRSKNLNTRVNITKSVIDLPAGPVTMSVTLNSGWGWSQNDRHDPTWPNLYKIRTRYSLMGEASISIPLSRRRVRGKSPIGELSVDVSANAQTMTNSRAQTRLGMDVNWSPSAILRMKGSIEHLGTGPSFEQLDGPLVTAVNRIFDYSLQEMTEPTWITGGNPDLQRGFQHNLSVTAQIRPLGNELLTLNVGYRKRIARNGISSFPELTPVIEMAFAERVTRDSEGRLNAVDARAINIAHEINDELTSGVALRFPAGRDRGRQSRNTPQFSLVLAHNLQLQNELLIHAGIPKIDQLRVGGQSRHRLRLQLTTGWRGLGATINGNWSSAARVSATTASNPGRSFRYITPVTINLSAFVEPEHIFEGLREVAPLKNLRISVDVQNLLNKYRQIMSSDIPLTRSRYEVDPLGRTIRLSMRKKF